MIVLPIYFSIFSLHWLHADLIEHTTNTPIVENVKRELGELTKSLTLILDNPMSSDIKEVWRCQQFSSFQTAFLRTLLNHHKSAHKNEISFPVKYKIESCMFNFNKFKSYYKLVWAQRNSLHSYSLKSIKGIMSWNPRNFSEQE